MASTFILRSTDPIELFALNGGGKAQGLALLPPGLSPLWFCVSNLAYEEFLRVHGLDAFVRSVLERAAAGGVLEELARQVEGKFLESGVPASVRLEVESACRELGILNEPVAVRSSASGEDSLNGSFAGLYASFLWREGLESVLEALVRSWASLFSARALAYRLERGGWGGSPQGLSVRVNTAGAAKGAAHSGERHSDSFGMAVVVQRMVRARVSGVVFSRNPVRPFERDSLVIEAVRGSGDALMNGGVTPTRFELRRSDGAIAGGSARDGGVSPARDLALGSNELKRVRGLAVLLEEKRGAPQDVEWAFEGEQLFCLQSRPITGLPPAKYYQQGLGVDGSVKIWDDTPVIEGLRGVASPLTFDFSRLALGHLHRQLCLLVGVSAADVTARESLFFDLVGHADGRIRYDLARWHEYLRLLPFGKGSDSADLAELAKILPSELRAFVETQSLEGVRRSRRASPGVLARFRLLVRTALWLRDLDGLAARFQARVSDWISKSESKASDEPHDDEKARVGEKFAPGRVGGIAGSRRAIEKLMRLEREVLADWREPVINDYLLMFLYGLLRKLTASWIDSGPRGAALLNEWLRVEVKKGEGGSLKLEEAGAEGAEGVAGVDASMSAGAPSGGARALISSELPASLPLRGLRQSFFEKILRMTRAVLRNRESYRVLRTKIFAHARKLVLQIGEELNQKGILRDPLDVFFFRLEELQSLERADVRALRNSVMERKAAYAMGKRDRRSNVWVLELRWGDKDGSYRLLYPLARSGSGKSVRSSSGCSSFVGQPSSPGVAEGGAYFGGDLPLSDLERTGRAVPSGVILVLNEADPAWVVSLSRCAGLVIERGSVLSHLSVVARELGVPMVVGVDGEWLSSLKEGWRLRIDGGTGEVRVLEESGEG